MPIDDLASVPETLAGRQSPVPQNTATVLRRQPRRCIRPNRAITHQPPPPRYAYAPARPRFARRR